MKKIYQRFALGFSPVFLLLIPNIFPSLFTPLSRSFPTVFSEWNAPKPMHLKLLNGALNAGDLADGVANSWSALPDQGWKICGEFSNSVKNKGNAFPQKQTRGYIQVFLDGGLNQQRMGICDAVAVAKILNVTLIIPHLEVNPVWQDTSSFADIFDADHFISILSDDVSIVKELPAEYAWSTREYYATGIRATRIKTAPLHASPLWYIENILPVIERSSLVFSNSLQCLYPLIGASRNSTPVYSISRNPHSLLPQSLSVKDFSETDQLRSWGDGDGYELHAIIWKRINYGIAAVAPFSHRLAFDNLPSDIQRLRCKVNFHALAFVPHIISLAETLIDRLRSPLSMTGKSLNMKLNKDKGVGKYVVLHLRFDKDMAAHSACDFGGGEAEKRALAKYRQVIWQGRVLNSQFTDEELRVQGRCPLTPEEIGLLLTALGFNNDTQLYLASHKVYGGEARISTLRKLFPLLEDKRSLLSAEERAAIHGKASVSAAVDYHVSMQSDIFISASPGNMHNALLGHRAYKNLKTIKPNMILLGKLFLNKSLEWLDFQKAVVDGHKNRYGQIRLRKEKQSIYTYPAPDCMCKD